MFMFGYNLGVINAPQSVIVGFIKDVDRARKNITNSTDELLLSDSTVDFIWAVVVSIFAVGGMIGGAVGGWLSEAVGRKGGLLLNTWIAIIGAILMWCSFTASSYEMIIIGRFIIGVSCGVSTILSPMYVSEIAPVDRRGGLGVFNQLAVTFGLLVGQVLGLDGLLGDEWPTLLGIILIPPALQFVCLFFCCESPRFLLLQRHSREKARRALVGLRGVIQVEPEIDEILKEHSELASHHREEPSFLDFLTKTWLRRPIVIAVVMQLSQQLNGILAIFYYSTDIFLSAGMSESVATGATCGVGLVMVVMTLVSVPLIETRGRKSLHLFGLVGMFVLSILITISLSVEGTSANIFSVIVVLGYVVFFAIGPGSIPWLITAELFSQTARAKAMAIAVAFNWGSNFLAGISFPFIQDYLKQLVFLPFTALLFLFAAFTYSQVPETKGKTVQEIAALFRATPGGVPSHSADTPPEGNDRASPPDYGTTSAPSEDGGETSDKADLEANAKY
ncbi:unnamed protein product [Cyprideis torosa]|uniref:Uncharacterized protein n=1 Tax=Cyprideis torosa TaxID=163714 RepID=A0A7R8WLR6_9CRUS|nr:unnamed protein product [Cyprideis torosa]CAG0898504.1 unnamed protein product [Cyprideis torosa]